MAHRKWDQKEGASMYLTAITVARNIRTVRDLTAAHLPMLRAIQKQGVLAAARYGVKRGEVKFFVHYQPSYCTLSYTLISQHQADM